MKTATLGPLTRQQLHSLRVALTYHLESLILLKAEEDPGERRQWQPSIQRARVMLDRIDKAERTLTD